MSSVLMRFMHSIIGRDTLSLDSTGRARAGVGPPGSGALMLGRFVLVHCDDFLIFSKIREEHLVHERMVLETLRHYKLYAKASKCKFDRSSGGFLGHVIAASRSTLARSLPSRNGPRGDADVFHGYAPLRRPCQLTP